MKNISILFALIAIMLLTTSCYSTRTITIKGDSGAEIYTPAKTYLGTINNNGELKTKIDCDDYFAYLLSKDKGSETLVPFALDYDKNKYLGTKVLVGTGYTFAGIGLAGLFSGCLYLAVGAHEALTTIALAGGGGASLLALAIGWPADSRLKQVAYDYQYKYVGLQSTNNDILFSKCTFSEPYKDVQLNDEVAVPVLSSPAVSKTSSASVKKEAPSQKSTKTLRDIAKQIEGTYKGNGSLTKAGASIESYSDIEVKVIRVDKKTVKVNVVESNGSEFFETYTMYTISKDKKGGYILKNADVSAASITIDKNGQMDYNHPKVNIDGDIYSLIIRAKGKKPND